MYHAARMLSDDQAGTINVKTALHSPGDVILQIVNFVKDNALPFLLCYIAIFGGRVGDYEFNSIISIIKNLLNTQYEKQKQKLELRKLEAETKIAEQEAISKELDNLQRTYELQAKLIDDCAEPLTIAANKLKIQPADSTRIAITELLETSLNAKVEV